MGQDTIVSFCDPAFRDELSDPVRQARSRSIRQAVEAEFKAFLEAHEDARDERGRRAVVRNGYRPQPEREVLTGIGAVKVQVPKTRDRAGEGRCFRCHRT